MSSTNFENGDIYYDNMEIMENIQKLKSARTAKDRPPLPSQPPPPGASYAPQLPPKKKNLGRPVQNIVPKAPSKPSLMKKSLSAQTQKNNKPNITSPRRPIVVSNPSSQPTPQNVNNQASSQPKPPIRTSDLSLNFKANPKVKPVQQSSLQSNTAKKTAIPQSPINPKPAQVWSHPSLLRTKSIVEEPLAPIVEEDTVSEISPRSSTADEYSLRQSRLSSEDGGIPQFESVESIPNESPFLGPNSPRTSATKIGETRSSPDKSDSGTRYADSNNESNTSQQPAGLDDGLVRPYGMVNLQLHDNGPDVQNTKVTKFGQKQLREGLALKGFSKVPSAFEKNARLESPSSPAPRSPADFGHSSEDSGSGVCAYMSIPIQMQTGSEVNAPSHLATKKETTSERKGPSNNNKYKDDEYIYDEIQDFNKDVASCDDAMQKALDDINEVLQSMNIDGITSPIPQPRAKRFPVAAGDKEIGYSQEYDNFSNKVPDQATSPKSSAAQSGRRKFNSARQDMALPAPPEPPPSPSRTPRSANVGKTTIRSDSQSSGDIRANVNDRKVRQGRLSSEDSESRDLRSNNSRSNLQELDTGAAFSKDNTEQSNTLNKSHEYIGKKELDSSSRRTSRGDISSEADSWSVSGKQSDTTSGIVKSTGNSMSSLENIKGSTKSLGRSSSFDRKKSSSFRAKFKFRVRSKSQDRYRGDSDSLGPSVSDAEDKAKSPRQRGSRLRRRLSRKRMENKEASETKSVEEFKVANDNRPSPSVSFIRRLLRKTKQSSNERPMSYGKPVIATPAQSHEDATVDTQSPPQYQPETAAREKQMVSPPSRRARKMLHPRSTREKAMSDSSNSDMDNDHRRCVQAETLKQNDEYLEPCDPRDTTSGEPTRERGRRMNAYRSKPSRDRVDSSGMSSLHREKYKALVSLNAQTLKKITEKWLKEWRNKLPVGGFLITSWADIVIASKHPQCTIGRTVIYESYFATNPEHRLACQIFDRKDVNERLVAHLENCSSLTAHPTLCSVCSHFYCKVPGSLLYPPREEAHVEALCVVLSNVPAATLATYISQLRKVKEQKRKHKQILLMLLQLLQAMNNLSHSGFTPSNITVDNLIVTQDMGLLQVMPHMDILDHTSNGPIRPKTLMSQFSGVLSWTLQMGLDQEGMSTPSFPLYSYLSAILRISRAIVTSQQEFEIVALQRLVQCALWGPKSRNEVSVTNEDIYDTLSAWIEVKQAELVSDIAVLFTAKSDTFPIYLFYKHEYFSHVDPRTLFQNLRILGRI